MLIESFSDKIHCAHSTHHLDYRYYVYIIIFNDDAGYVLVYMLKLTAIAARVELIMRKLNDR